MIDTLGDVYRLQGENERSILGHYLQYLESRYPLWHSAAPFSAAGDAAAAQTRVQTLADHCARLLAQKYGWAFIPAGRYGDASVVPLETFGFAREFHLSAEWDGRLFKGVKATLWLGNNREQGFYFFNDGSVRDDLSWTRSDKLGVADGAVKAEITPYVKFSHIMGRHVTHTYCAPEEIDTDRQEVREKIFAPLVKKWTRGNWPALWSFLTQTHPGLLKDPKGFEADFDQLFDGSSRQFAFVTFGYETVMRFPIDRLETLDAGSGADAGSDKAAEWVVNVIEALKTKISGPGN
jgi:hypothetical protein